MGEQPQGEGRNNGGTARRLARFGWPVALVLLAALLYGRTARFPFVIFDDYSKIVENREVAGNASAAQRLLTPAQGYPIPVTVAYWTAAHALGNGAPWPFHVGNLLLHAGVLLLLYTLVRRLSGSHHAAGFAGLVLLAHPVTVEPVAWATGAKDLLAALLALGATAVFVARVAPSSTSSTGGPRSFRRYGAGPAALLLALAAMLAKPTVVLLGLAWLAYLGARALARQPSRRTDWALAAGVLGLGLALGLLARFSHDLMLLEAAEREVFTLGDLRLPQALGHQLSHLLWPASLHPIYLVDKAAGLGDWRTIVGIAALAGLALIGWLARRAPAAMLGLGLAVASYLPVSSLLPFPRTVADSYLYLPLAGLLVAAAAATCSPRYRRIDRQGRIAAVVALVLCLALLPSSWRQVDRWRGGSALWQPTIARYGSWERPYGALATALLRAGDGPAAAERFAQAFARGYRRAWLGDFGVALAQARRLDEAECVMLEAIHHGKAARVALGNYAVLLGGHARPPRYPQHAAALLPLIDAEARAGRLRAGPRLRRALARHRQRVGPAPATAPSWPRGGCPILRRR